MKAPSFVVAVLAAVLPSVCDSASLNWARPKADAHKIEYTKLDSQPVRPYYKPFKPTYRMHVRPPKGNSGRPSKLQRRRASSDPNSFGLDSICGAVQIASDVPKANASAAPPFEFGAVTGTFVVPKLSWREGQAKFAAEVRVNPLLLTYVALGGGGFCSGAQSLMMGVASAVSDRLAWISEQKGIWPC
jgi:hypothetical protein